MRWTDGLARFGRNTLGFVGWTAVSCIPFLGQAPQPIDEGTPVLFGTNVEVQNSVTTKGVELGQEVYDDSKKPERQKRGEFAVAPIPIVNPSIGNGGGLGVLYAIHLRREDSSAPSTFGIAVFATAAGSWGLGGGASLRLKDDKYRISVGGGGGKFNYNYFGTGTAGGDSGTSIPLSQNSAGFLIEPKIRFFRNWYAGPRYHVISNRVALNSTRLDPNNLPIKVPTDVNLKTAAFGGRLQRDSSDNPFYPRKGSVLDVLGDLYGPGVGGTRTYQNLTTSYNLYMSAGSKNVFAIHGSVCMATAKAPFYDLCELGQTKDIRGYQIGQFRDNRMLVGQAEYRRDLFWRLGAVAFAGAGAVAHTWGGFGDTEPKPGGGLGLRFILAKKNHINLRADYAWGQGTHAAYISLGEAF
jgi:hypothetical protein